MSQDAGPGYYEARGERLLRSFDRAGGRTHRVLARHHDSAFADSVVADARVEFERIIPEIPYIGGKGNLFSGVMIANGWIAAGPVPTSGAARRCVIHVTNVTGRARSLLLPQPHR